MTKEEYLEKLKILSKKYRKKEMELKKEFAFSNNSIKIGDIPCKNCKKYVKGGFEKDITNQGDYGLMDTSEINFLENAY